LRFLFAVNKKTKRSSSGILCRTASDRALPKPKAKEGTSGEPEVKRFRGTEFEFLCKRSLKNFQFLSASTLNMKWCLYIAKCADGSFY